MEWPRPFAYLKSLASADSTDRTNAWVVVATTLTLCGAVLWSSFKLNVPAMGVSIAGLTSLAAYAYGRGKKNEETLQGQGEGSCKSS